MEIFLIFIALICVVNSIAGSSLETGVCSSIPRCMEKLEKFVDAAKSHLDAFPWVFLPARCNERTFRVQTTNVTLIETRLVLWSDCSSHKMKLMQLRYSWLPDRVRWIETMIIRLDSIKSAARDLTRAHCRMLSEAARASCNAWVKSHELDRERQHSPAQISQHNNGEHKLGQITENNLMHIWCHFSKLKELLWECSIKYN